MNQRIIKIKLLEFMSVQKLCVSLNKTQLSRIHLGYSSSSSYELFRRLSNVNNPSLFRQVLIY